MVLQIAVILAGALLSYVVHRQRMASENHKKAWGNAFIGMLVISAAGSIWLAVRAEESAKSDRDRSAQKATRDSLQVTCMQDTVMAVRTGQIQQSFEARVQSLESKAQVSDVQLQLASFRAAVQPLVNLAEVRYPGLEADVALRQLAADFVAIRAENARLSVTVSEIERRDDYRPLVPALRDSIGRCLRALGEVVPGDQGDIPICTNGNKQNIAIAHEIDSLLTRARIAPRCQVGVVNAGSPFECIGRVILAGPAELIPDLETLRRPLSIIFRDSIILVPVGDPYQTGLWFMDTPQFDSLGRVRFI